MLHPEDAASFERDWPGGINGLRGAVLEHLSRAGDDGWESASSLLQSIREEGFLFSGLRSTDDFADLCDFMGFSVRRCAAGWGYITEIGV